MNPEACQQCGDPAEECEHSRVYCEEHQLLCSGCEDAYIEDWDAHLACEYARQEGVR